MRWAAQKEIKERLLAVSRKERDSMLERLVDEISDTTGKLDLHDATTVEVHLSSNPEVRNVDRREIVGERGRKALRSLTHTVRYRTVSLLARCHS